MNARELRVVLGVIAEILCHFGVVQKGRMGYDDSLGIVGIYGAGASVALYSPDRALDSAENCRWDGEPSLVD